MRKIQAIQPSEISDSGVFKDLRLLLETNYNVLTDSRQEEVKELCKAQLVAL